jgi:hypothetical protein
MLAAVQRDTSIATVGLITLCPFRVRYRSSEHLCIVLFGIRAGGTVLTYEQWLERFETHSYGERAWGDHRSYKYVRTTVTHSKKGFAVAVETDGFSYKGRGITLDQACARVMQEITGSQIEGIG